MTHPPRSPGPATSGREALPIQRLEVRAFRSLESLSLELGQVNVFIGANGSGKSNLLEALGTLGAAAEGRVDAGRLLERGVRPGVPRLFKSAFRQADRRNAIRLEAHSAAASYAVELHNPRESAVAWEFKTEQLISDGEKLVGRSPATVSKGQSSTRGLAALSRVEWDDDEPGAELLDALDHYAIFAPATNVLRGLVPDAQQAFVLGLTGGSLPAALKDLKERWSRSKSKQARGDYSHAWARVEARLVELIGWADSVRAVDTVDAPIARGVPTQSEALLFRDRFMKASNNTLTGFDASEGALYVVFAAVAMLHPDMPKLMAVDNMDSALNPRLSKALMEQVCVWVLENPCKQVLCTVHNPTALDGLPLEDDRIRLFAVDRSLSGRTEVRRVVVTPRLMELAKQGWTLSRLWVTGQIGGVPNV